MGIKYVGPRVADILARAFGDIEKLSSSDEGTLASIEGIGPTIASSVSAFFRDAQNRKTLERLKAAGLNMSTAVVRGNEKKGPLAGQSFVFTGELEGMTRSEAESKVRELGGSTPSSVSRKTSFVVEGSNPGSKLAKAGSLGVRVIDEKAFLDLIGGAKMDHRPKAGE